jgi:glycosyltransferase involved in cell wall biosynthesis
LKKLLVISCSLLVINYWLLVVIIMKIGFDSKRLFCNFTGLGNYSRSLLSNLAKFYPEHSYFLYTTKIKESPRTKFFLDNPSYQVHISSAAFKAFWRSFSIVKQLKKDNIKLYHGLSHELPIGIGKSDIKTVVTIHDLIFKIYPQTYNIIDRFIYSWKFKYSCQHADKIVAISENTKQDIIKYYNIPAKKVEVIYQTCQPLYYNLSDPKTHPVVLNQYQVPERFLLYVGTVQERKNLKVIIKAYQHLAPEFKLPIVIVGNGGQYKKETKQLIKEQGMSNLVIWIEKLDNGAHLQVLYQAASILIYPSFYEGFGLPVAEALLSKTAVITADTSSLREAGGPYSIYINPRDDKELAEAISKVLRDTEFTAEMIAKGYDYAHKTFNPKLLSEQMINCYKNS